MQSLFRPLSLIGAIFSVLSILSLLYQGFNFGWQSPLRALLQDYDELVGVVVTATGAAWAVARVAELLREWVFPNLHLSSQWKHVFVLMWVYFGADAWTYLMRKRRFSALFTVAWGSVIAIVASIGFAVEMHAPLALQAVLWPCGGFVLYELGQAALCATYQRPQGKSRRAALGYFCATYVTTTALAGLGTILLGIAIQSQGSQVPSIALLAAFIMILAARNLLLGSWLSLSREGAWYDPLENRHVSEAHRHTWRWRFWRSSTSVQGMRIVFVLFWVAVFVLCDAGLSFLRAQGA